MHAQDDTQKLACSLGIWGCRGVRPTTHKEWKQRAKIAEASRYLFEGEVVPKSGHPRSAAGSASNHMTGHEVGNDLGSTASFRNVPLQVKDWNLHATPQV